MTKNILQILAFACILFAAVSDISGVEDESQYVFVPTESLPYEDPWRIVIYKDGTIKSQKLFFGCVREYGKGLKIENGTIVFTNKDDSKIKVKIDGKVLKSAIRKDGKDVEIEFSDNAEWKEKFNKAPPVPTSRKQAIATLDIILSKEDKEKLKGMKFDDLIRLHHGFGTGLRNGFGLWQEDSPIVKEYGGGHPDDVSMKIIEEYWNSLQGK